MQQPPIFIVGPPRSGTTLLAAMIASHSSIACGPETHFFSRLSDSALGEAIGDPDWPRKATKMLASLDAAGQTVIDCYESSLHAIESYLGKCNPSVAAMLESLTWEHARKMGKARWAEKTPNHLLEVRRIRREYPAGRIVRIVRDPRDVAVSASNTLPTSSNSFLANCQAWNRRLEATQRFFQVDDHAITILYEDLLADPVPELARLATFLQEEFEEGMLDTRRAIRSMVTPGEPWKRNAASPLDKSRAFAWKRSLGPELARAATVLCYPGIERFGYPNALERPQNVPALPFDARTIELNHSILLEATEEGLRFTLSERPSTASSLVVLRRPRSFTKRDLLAAAGLLRALLKRRIEGRPSFFVAETPERPAGRLDRLLWPLVRLLATEIQLRDLKSRLAPNDPTLRPGDGIASSDASRHTLRN